MVAYAAVIVTSPLTRGRVITTPMLTDVRRTRFGASSDLRFGKSTAPLRRLRTALFPYDGKNTRLRPAHSLAATRDPLESICNLCWKLLETPSQPT